MAVAVATTDVVLVRDGDLGAGGWLVLLAGGLVGAVAGLRRRARWR
jgi:hypothetical protein